MSERLLIEARLARGEVDVAFADSSAIRFQAKVFYALIPQASVVGQHEESASHAGHGRMAASTPLPRNRFPRGVPVGRSTGKRFLTGFDFQFTRGGHHIRSFGILQERTGYRAIWNDNNLDDASLMKVRYVVVH